MKTTKTFSNRHLVGAYAKTTVDAVNKYSVAFKPKIRVTFETYGVPLRATDFVSINGGVVRVVKVDHSFNPAENKWWMKVECERYQVVEAGSLLPMPAPPT